MPMFNKERGNEMVAGMESHSVQSMATSRGQQKAAQLVDDLNQINAVISRLRTLKDTIQGGSSTADELPLTFDFISLVDTLDNKRIGTSVEHCLKLIDEITELLI